MPNKKYTSRNYAKALEIITPNVYINEDLAIGGEGVDLIDEIINSHLNAAANFGDVLFVSSTGTMANMGNVSGITPYFVKQNNITNITANSFENDILHPLGYSLNDYSTSTEFISFLSGTLLPKIRLNDPEIAKKTSAAQAMWGTNSDSSSTHEFLSDALGWFYFLNTSAGGGLSYEPSSYVLSSLATKTYLNKPLVTVDGIKGLTHFIWKNYEACSTFRDLNLIPSEYVSGVPTSKHTSGTQQLEKLETLLDITYSPQLFDKDDVRVQEIFESYISTGGQTNSSLEPKGPFYKFLKGLGFSLGKLHQDAEKLDFVYDIGNCPEEYLEELANLIGWRLYGYDSSRWRLQLRKAVEIYKAVGTKNALQLAINAVFADETYDLSGNVVELYESYVPHLLYYALATYSTALTNRTKWTQEVSSKLQIPEYNYSNFDENIRNYVDYILLDLVQNNPDNFIFSGTTFPISKVLIRDTGSTFCLTPAQLKYKDYSFIPPTQLEAYGNALLEGAKPFSGPDGEGVYRLGKAALLEEGCGESSKNVYLDYVVQNKDFVFNYRQHKNFPIPPFEEILYYKDTRITQEIVNRIIDRLGCIGISEEGTAAVSDYILDNSLKAVDDIRSTNTFLLFTSSLQVPPNFQEVLSSSSVNRSEFLSLWSGKSSHFRVSFDASNFNFSSKAQSKDSAFAILDSARIAQKFSPAHATPVIDTYLTTEDTVVVSSTFSDSLIDIKENDNMLTHGGALNRLAASSINTRGINTDNTFKRRDLDNTADSLFSVSSMVSSIPRNSFRRRDYKNLLPNEGAYYRSGFNGPINLDASTLENSAGSSLGFIPLGYIPSAGKFHPIVDYIRDTRGPYDSCETQDSGNTFFGVDTSNTFPCRGLYAPVTASGDYTGNYIHRSTLPDILATIHRLGEGRKLSSAKDYVLNNFYLSSLNFYKDYYWKNNEQSYVNSSTQTSGAFPNSELDYQQFSFGPDLHKLYRIYTNVFGKHHIPASILNSLGGPDILSHTYGPLVYNGGFSVGGETVKAASGISNLINPGIVNISNVDLSSSVVAGASGILSPCAVDALNPADYQGSGTLLVDSYTDLIVPLVGQALTIASSMTTSGAEFRNKHILSGVEFVGTSGASLKNNFQVFRLDASNYGRYKGNYAINNTLIKFKAIDGLPRIRFDLSKSYTPNNSITPPYTSLGPKFSNYNYTTSTCTRDRTAIDYFSSNSNFLTPDHDFRLNIKALTGRESSPVLGGDKFSVWIHTGIDSDGYYYYWNKFEGVWSRFNAKNITRDDIIQTQSIAYTPEKVHPKELINCFDKIQDAASLESNPGLLLDLESYHFNNFECAFNTDNKKTCGTAIHTYDTEYYVEVFLNPSITEGNDIYLLLDTVDLRDNTLFELANLVDENKTFSLEACPSLVKTKVCSEELRDIFLFYNRCAASSITVTDELGSISKKAYGDGLATRVAFDSSSNYYVSGGGRNSYREAPDNYALTARYITTKQITHLNVEDGE